MLRADQLAPPKPTGWIRQCGHPHGCQIISHLYTLQITEKCLVSDLSSWYTFGLSYLEILLHTYIQQYKQYINLEILFSAEIHIYRSYTIRQKSPNSDTKKCSEPKILLERPTLKFNFT